MELLHLPAEILIHIIRYCDLPTLHQLYNTSSRLRNIVCMVGVIKQCHISMNTMATANTLKLDLIKDISSHLQVLNMRAVPDLSASALITALKALTSLKRLDVSYTDIHIIDLITIPEICPTLNDITVNFKFINCEAPVQEPVALKQCETLFEQFEYIHFIGSENSLLESKFAFYLLRNAKLIKTLKYSISLQDNDLYTLDSYGEWNQIPDFIHFAVYMMDWRAPDISVTYMNIADYTVLSMFDLKKYEYIIMAQLEFYKYSVNVSPLFIDLFTKIGVAAKCENVDQNNILGDNTAIMIWRKETTKFDKDFFDDLMNRIKQYYLHFFFRLSDDVVVPKSCNKFYTELIDIHDFISDDEQRNDVEGSDSNSTELNNLILDYDRVFKEVQDIKLSIYFNIVYKFPNLISLSVNSEFLRKLTFLTIHDLVDVNYSPDFYNTLFRCCNSLVTLNVEYKSKKHSSSIPNNFSLSHSLKNIRISDHAIDFDKLFFSLSQCLTLENIYIIDKKYRNDSNLTDATMILDKCVNLYNMSVYVRAPRSHAMEWSRKFNDAKNKCGRSNINLNVSLSKHMFQYDPFLDVVDVNLIKPI